MNKFRLSTKLLSDAFWRAIFAPTTQLRAKQQELLDLTESLEVLRAQAEYNTGSIGFSSAWSLYSVCRYFAPQRALEVGTFIGKSAISIAKAIDDNATGFPGELHTCDFSNAIRLPWQGQTRIHQYLKQSSTDMLLKLEGQFDFAHIDGRLQTDDFSLLASRLTPDAIVALDDFEGMEKGVINLINIRNAGICASHTLIYPCEGELLRQYGFSDRSLTALMIPVSLIELTSQ